MASSSKGNCYLCGAELGKTAMKNHILKAHNEKEGGQKCRLLKIEGAYDKNYWLLIDLPAEKSLAAVDKFLRKIWLECCWHLSRFYLPGNIEVDPRYQLNDFSTGDQLWHEYDFGTPTVTVITVMGNIKRKPQRKVVRLLARNIPPQFQCKDCGAEAEYFCGDCSYKYDNPLYCSECLDKHEHDDYLLPVTNSPRMGECGYCGELDTYGFIPPKA